MPDLTIFLQSFTFKPLFDMCKSAIETDGSILAALFLAGLAGSLSHCSVMCSGFVVAQSSSLPKNASLMSQTLWPYHLGRIMTYVGLGALASAAFALFSSHPLLPLLSRLMLGLAGMIFALMSLEFLLSQMGVRFSLPFMGLKTGCLVQESRKLLHNNAPFARFILGLGLGTLPCGLIYTAIIAASSRANPVTGALGMALFGLGTVPVLLGVAGLAAQFFFKLDARLNTHLKTIFRVFALGLNAVLLVHLAFG